VIGKASAETTVTPLGERIHPRDIVLVVDDSPEALSFLTHALEEAGITVLVAVDGAAALHLMAQITPDLVLLDAVMPGLSGFETCRRLKQNDDLAHVPVIFMTGLTETEHIVKGLEAGGVDYVAKPIVVDELMARMRVHLTNARRTQDARIALDTAGRFLLAVSGDGRILWNTPQAAKLLKQLYPALEDQDFRLPSDLTSWITRAAMSGRNATAWSVGDTETRLELSYLGQVRADEHVLRLSGTQPGGEIALLRQRLSLTAREAEVLLWLARGKSNRDISDILKISPRTVNKHLEQIYEKLGVENRASATALAVRALSDR
jgi:DNA-binding response OmpR family regulator/DNA-binding CsgD family transcriptional regulator